MKRTVFKVILRKSEYKEQWSLLIESFPVFEPGKAKPLRKHEPLGRFITTPIFDKNSSGRTLADGKAYYRPKRDANGIILCRSQKDQEACIFADKVRDLRQHEYDNQSLYTDSEAEQAAQNERSKCDFIKYFEELVMCKKLVASVDRFDKVVPLTEFLGEDNLPGKPLLVRFVNWSLNVISF